MIPQEIIDNMEDAERFFYAAYLEVKRFKSQKILNGPLDKMDKYRFAKAKAEEHYYQDQMKGHYHIIRELHLLDLEEIKKQAKILAEIL